MIKPNYRVILIIFNLFILLNGCSKEHTTEPDTKEKSIQALFGTYKTSTFIVSDPTDRPLDILSAGGTLTVSLKENFTYTGSLFIPENYSCPYPNGKTEYYGEFSISKDSIEFASSNYFPLKYIFWDKENGLLETYSIRRLPHNIILSKIESDSIGLN